MTRLRRSIRSLVGSGLAAPAVVGWVVGCVVGCAGAPPGISEIQGSEPYSPFKEGQVTVEGLVTAVLPSEGFFLAATSPDDRPETSDGILVLGGAAQVGDRVEVSGVVVEVQRNPQELSQTAIMLSGSSGGVGDVRVLASGAPLPEPPAVTGDQTTLEAAIAYWEAREGMRVRVPGAAVIGPSNRFGESVVVVGTLDQVPAGLAVRHPRGALVLDNQRYLPPRILLDDSLVELPALRVGDRITEPFDAIVDYRFGNYRLYPTAPLAAIERSTAGPERAAPIAASDRGQVVSVASLNVENLDPGDDNQKFNRLAAIVVEGLGAPELVALQEVQDDSGRLDDGVVGSAVTHQRLIAAIAAAGGPGYSFREVAPGNNQDGGEPWGNIRSSFLLRSDSRLRFVDRPASDPASAAGEPASARRGAGGVEIVPSPGRIEPANPAFRDSRKPLVAELRLGDRTLVVINVHLASKGADDPAYGVRQPPVRASETQRNEQAAAVARFVESVLALDPDTAILVLGDFNDFTFSDTLVRLEAAGLTNLVQALPPEERWSYIYQGQAQVLDQALVSAGLLRATPALDIVHTNAELAESDRASDHDPLVVRWSWDG